ncbi:MAG TPA: SIMPL domain-containing protein [Bryobacteraceae bacterium]|nr:SIMPL domain-containing protein [Bryobacteraceae bacterium]
MTNLLRLTSVLALCWVPVLNGQTAVNTRPQIKVTGEGQVAARPDQAKVAIGVVTTAPAAQDAANQNADRVTAVLNAMRSVLGAGAEIETISYSLNPNYSYPAGGQPTLTGYTATNIVEATVTDLSLIGRLIDEAIRAGGNRVSSLRFGLRNDGPQREAALRAAVQQARSKAQALASGAGVRLGQLLVIEENFGVAVVPPLGRTDAAGALAATTPVETGQVEVRAAVVLQVEMLQ